MFRGLGQSALLALGFWLAAPTHILQPLPAPVMGVPLSLQLPGEGRSLPIVVSQSVVEGDIQQDLQRGLSWLPDYNLIAGHSSGPVSFGPYRDAFADLNTVIVGDSIRLHTASGDGIYIVWKKETVWPSQVDKIPVNDGASITLVTCWPPGTNLKRLLIHARLTHVDN